MKRHVNLKVYTVFEHIKFFFTQSEKNLIICTYFKHVQHRILISLQVSKF